MFTSERLHYSLALFSSFICTCTTSKRYKFASKRTLDYSPKKYPVYANNWLVVTDSSDSRNGECHGSSCRMQYLIILMLLWCYNVPLTSLQFRDQSSRNILCKCQERWKRGRPLNRASNITNFSPDFVFTSERPLHSLALFSSFICTCTTSKRYKFASKRTLDYFPKKYSEYAKNWLVSRTAVRAETMDVTAYRVGCNT